MTKKKEQLHVKNAIVEDDETGNNMFARLEVENDSDTTLHFIAVARQVLYDPATKELTVRLTDSALAELPIQPPFEVPPPIAAVDPHDKREIVVKLPRFVTRVEPGPQIVQLPAHEAQSVTIEVGWSDKAFYRDPREKRGGGSMRSQLKNWERGVAKTQTGEVKKKGKPAEPKEPRTSD